MWVPYAVKKTVQAANLKMDSHTVFEKFLHPGAYDKIIAQSQEAIVPGSRL